MEILELKYIWNKNLKNTRKAEEEDRNNKETGKGT